MPDQNDIVFSQNTSDFFAVIEAVLRFFGSSDASIASLFSFLNSLWGTFVILSFLVAFLSLVGYIYASIRLGQLGEVQSDALKAQEKLYAEMYGGSARNSRLVDVEQHITTDNPNDWKLAIIEADIILDDVLDAAGYTGASIGEKLKSASPTSFATLDDAWQAHKVRNRIAHDGADFVLTKKLAQETVVQYKRVFAEFGVS